MVVFQLWLLFAVAIIGVAPRGVPGTKERADSGPVEAPRASKKDYSSGTLDCSDCDLPDQQAKQHGDDSNHGAMVSSSGKGSSDPAFSFSYKEKRIKHAHRRRKSRHGKRGGSSNHDEIHKTSQHDRSSDSAIELGASELLQTEDSLSKESYVHQKNEQTKQLAANIKHNIKRLGEISDQIKKLTGGNVEHNLKLDSEPSVGKDKDYDANAETKAVDIAIETESERIAIHKKIHSKKTSDQTNVGRTDDIATHETDNKLKNPDVEIKTHGKLLTDDKGKHKPVHDNEKEKINQDNEKALSEKEEKEKLNHAKHVDHQDTVLVPADTDERKPDHIVLGKGGVDDRWSRPGLSQVPDAARLERRLHPTIDAPIRDIMRSLENMLHRVQSTVNRADHDYQYVFNSTRWTIMVGVRERLKRLIEQNDAVYDTVLQASLLTKEIYRRAHERRLYGTPLSPAAVRSRDPVISTVHLRPLYRKVREELDKSQQLKEYITRSISKRGDLHIEMVKVQRKVDEQLPTRALHDLTRRARQAISLLQSAHTQRDMEDKVHLSGHMRSSTWLNIEQGRNFTRVGWEELSHAKRTALVSKRLAYDVIKAHRNRAPASPSHTEMDHARMLLWRRVDIAALHADDLFKSAATIHMKLQPLLGNAELVLKNYDRDPLSKRLAKVAEKITSDLKALRRVMDQIILSLGAEHLLRERCDTVEGSGDFGVDVFSDDEDDDGWVPPLIDCDQYVTITSGGGESGDEGSGDGEVSEGSGEFEGVLVDMDKPTMAKPFPESSGDTHDGSVDIDITDMTNISASIVDESGNIYIDEDLEGQLVLPTDGEALTTETPKSVDVDIGKDSKQPVTDSPVKGAILIPGDSDDEDIIKEALKTKTTSKPYTTKPEIAKPTTTKQASTTKVKPSTSAPSAVIQVTTVTTKAPTEAAQVTSTTTKLTTKATEATTTDPKATTKAAQATTTTHQVTTITTTTTKAPPTTTKEGDGDFGIGDWFGLWEDQPVIDDTEVVDESALSLNELLRSRLSEAASSSRDIYANASLIKERSEEQSQTWEKVQLRFGQHELRSLEARAFTHEWEAELAAFQAVHDRVQNVLDDVALKTDLVESQSAKAIEKAERKLEIMEARYKSRSEEAGQAADPVVVRETIETVAKVTHDVNKIVELTQLTPSPCKVAESYRHRIQANISELRQKIEHAKLIASSLQVAVALDGSSHLHLPLQQIGLKHNPLSTRLQVVAKVTDSDGVVVGVETNETGSFILKMEDRIPRVIAFDDGKSEIDDISTEIELEDDTWYNFVLERIAQTFNLTVYDVTTNDVVSHSSVKFDDDDLKIAQSPPTVVYVGGLSDEYYDYGQWAGCIGSVTLDGQVISLLRKDSNNKLTLPGACRSEKEIYNRKSSLVLGGSGFAHYDLAPIVRRQRAIHSVGAKFRADSDGLLFSLANRRMRVFVRAVLDNDALVIHVQTANGRLMSAVAKASNIYGSDHSVLVNLQHRPTVTLDKTKMELRPATDNLVVNYAADEGLYIGATPTFNRSLVGCIHSVAVNKHGILLSAANSLQGGAFGTCIQSGCVTFSTTSSAITKKSMTDATSVHVVFAYGSVGPLLQYSKDKKFDATVTVDGATIEMFESVGEATENIPLQGYSKGDLVVITLTDKDSEVTLASGDESMSVEYEDGGGDGGWGGGWGGNKKKDDDDAAAATYTLAVGASTESDEVFTGRVDEVVINGRPMELRAHSKTNALGVCKARSHAVSHWSKTQAVEDEDDMTIC